MWAKWRYAAQATSTSRRGRESYKALRIATVGSSRGAMDIVTTWERSGRFLPPRERWRVSTPDFLMKIMRTVRLITPGLRANQHGNAGTNREARGLGSKRKSRKKKVIRSIALCMLMSGSIASVFGYLLLSGRYHRDMALAQTGVQHLQKAESLLAELPKNPLDIDKVNQARREFAA